MRGFRGCCSLELGAGARANLGGRWSPSGVSHQAVKSVKASRFESEGSGRGVGGGGGAARRGGGRKAIINDAAEDTARRTAQMANLENYRGHDGV